jgi:hypothetical protein
MAREEGYEVVVAYLEGLERDGLGRAGSAGVLSEPFY